MIWEILFIAGATALAFLGYQVIKGRPELFQGAVLDRALGTMGRLAIGLLLFVLICIYLLRSL